MNSIGINHWSLLKNPATLKALAKFRQRYLPSPGAAEVGCKMLPAIFVFKSSQGDVDTVTMENQDPIITALCREIEDQKVLQTVIDKHTESGQPLMNVLREENFLDEKQAARVIAAGNNISAHLEHRIFHC